MKPLIDLTGTRFGQLVAIRYSDKNDGRKAWVCECDCGAVKEIRGSDLRNGGAISCGCFIAKKLKQGLARKHGMYGSKTYKSWESMIQRCTSKNGPSYDIYGGRGIKVCERWGKFENFYADMGDRPVGKTLDRWPDKNGNYELSNCRWATKKEQSNNISTNRFALYRGESMTARQISDLTGVEYGLLRERIFKRGWSAEKAVETPKHQRAA